MNELRIGCVDYLNTMPLVAGLERTAGVTLRRAVPARLVGLLNDHAVDVAIASVVDAVAADTPLAFLPCGMIGCDGPTLTVRLFSTQPIDRIHTLHADTDSHTSVVLARLLLLHLHGARPTVLPYAAADARRAALGETAWPDTVLLIGDKVVNHPPAAATHPHQLDLGEAWHALTGDPFVYAMWMVREADASAPWLPAAAALLDRQLRRNLARLDWVIHQHAHTHGWPVDTARHYIADLLRYRVGDRERQAVTRFLAMAAAADLLPSRAPRFIDLESLHTASPAASSPAASET